ncbi:MAG TPA: GIY-YIG nuclease family protein [Ktedonobacterales bacterium]|jgi:hypothetical protein
MTTGVYAIINTVTGEEYIGKSYNIEQRWREHSVQLRAGTGNKFFQHAWDTYGEAAFTFRILEECADLRQMDAAEVRHIAERKPAYNRSIPVAAGMLRVVTMTWPRDVAEQIDTAALARGLTKSELVVQILCEWLAEG